MKNNHDLTNYISKTYFLTISILALCLATIMPNQEVQAQKVLQIETRGKISTIKFYEGEALNVKLNTDKFWRQGYILEIDVDNDVVVFDFGPVQLDEIKSIKTLDQKTRGKKIRKGLMYSSLGFLIYTPLELLRDNPNYGMIAFGASLSVIGVLLKPIFDFVGQHRIGGRKRLRLLDLTFAPPLPRS